MSFFWVAILHPIIRILGQEVARPAVRSWDDFDQYCRECGYPSKFILYMHTTRETAPVLEPGFPEWVARKFEKWARETGYRR